MGTLLGNLTYVPSSNLNLYLTNRYRGISRNATRAEDNVNKLIAPPPNNSGRFIILGIMLMGLTHAFAHSIRKHIDYSFYLPILHIRYFKWALSEKPHTPRLM